MIQTTSSELKTTACSESIWSSLSSFFPSTCMSSSRTTTLRVFPWVSSEDLPSRSFRPSSISEKRTSSIVISNLRIYYSRAQINQESKLLTLGLVVFQMRGSIPIFNQGFIELQRSLWEFLTQEQSICGVLVVFLPSFSQVFLCSQEKVSKSSYLW